MDAEGSGHWVNGISTVFGAKYDILYYNEDFNLNSD
jgi:hypothetical protein